MSRFLRLARLIEIIHLINTKQDWTAKKLAEHFEISEKRIYNDISELNAANIPIIFEGMGYKFLTRVKFPAKDLLELMETHPYPDSLNLEKQKRKERSEKFFISKDSMQTVVLNCE